MFPALDFSVSAYEPLADFALRGTIKDGKLELLDEPVIWKTITGAKTGETVSGTLEEIGAVLGTDPCFLVVPAWYDGEFMIGDFRPVQQEDA